MRSAVFLPIPGIAWNRAESRSAIARWSSAGDALETTASATFGPMPLTPEELHEERALRRVGEAVELESVLADVEVRLDRHLGRAVGAPQHARRRADEVPDARDVDDEPVDRATRGNAAKPRDHRATSTSGDPSAWQIATANASASCVERGSSSSPRMSFTIRCTCALLGAPVAAHRLLDARRRVLSALDSGGGGRDEHGAARLPDGERDAGVGTHVGLLERDGVGLVLRNELPNSLEDRQQPRVEPLPRGRPPAARRHRPEAPVASVDDPVPARSRPWVDAEDLHVWKLCGRPDVPPAQARQPVQFSFDQASRRCDAAVSSF